MKTIEQLAKLDQAYGKKLTRKRQLKIALEPAILLLLFGCILLGFDSLSPAQIADEAKQVQSVKVLPAKTQTILISGIKKSTNKLLTNSDLETAGVSKAQIKKIRHDITMRALPKNILVGVLSLWREIIPFLVGLIYGWKVILPKRIRQEYNMKALEERNAAINLLTQSLLDTTRPSVYALQTARDNTHGKLKDDFRLLASVVSKRESDASIEEAFRVMINEYSDDVLFGLFLEQVQTYIIEGDMEPNTFENIKKQHNAMFNETTLLKGHQEEYHKALMSLWYMVAGVGVFTVVIVASMMTFGAFIKNYWAAPVGIGTMVIYGAAALALYNGFMKRYFDSDLMSL